MLECVICARHPHLPDTECSRDCRSRDADLGTICTGCAQRIRDDLDTLVDAWAATESPAFPGGSSGDGRAKSSPLPGGTDWMDWRQGAELFGVLTTWVRDWCDIYALAGPKRGDLTSVTGWLRAHLDHAANSHPAITDFADEIRRLAQRGRRLAGEVPDRGQRVPCPTDDCGRTLRVRVVELEAVVRCKSCGIERSSAQILVIAGHSEAWVPGETAAMVAEVSLATIKRWAQGGHIEREHGRYWLPSVREYKAKRGAA